MFRPRFSKTMRTPTGGWLGLELSSICPMSDARPDSASQPTSTSTKIAPMRNRSCRADTTEVLVPSAADWTGATNEFLDPSAAVWTNESYKSSYLKLALTLTIARTSNPRAVSSEGIRFESPSFRRASQETSAVTNYTKWQQVRVDARLWVRVVRLVMNVPGHKMCPLQTLKHRRIGYLGSRNERSDPG